jgi:hypothetical protein
MLISICGQFSSGVSDIRHCHAREKSRACSDRPSVWLLFCGVLNLFDGRRANRAGANAFRGSCLFVAGPPQVSQITLPVLLVDRCPEREVRKCSADKEEARMPGYLSAVTNCRNGGPFDILAVGLLRKPTSMYGKGQGCRFGPDVTGKRGRVMSPSSLSV